MTAVTVACSRCHPVPDPSQRRIDARACDDVREDRGDHRRTGEDGVERNGDPHRGARCGRTDDQTRRRVHDEHLGVGNHQPEPDDRRACGRDLAESVEECRWPRRAASCQPSPDGRDDEQRADRDSHPRHPRRGLTEPVDQMGHRNEDDRQRGEPDEPAGHEGQPGGPRTVGVQHEQTAGIIDTGDSATTSASGISSPSNDLAD